MNAQTTQAVERRPQFLPRESLQSLFSALLEAGYRILGPVVRDGAIQFTHMTTADALPVGVTNDQQPGHYRLGQDAGSRLFDWNHGPQALKPLCFAPSETLWLLLGALIGGVLGATVMVVFYFIGVFLMGALAGALVADTIGQAFGVDLHWLVLIIAAVTVGVMALFFQRYAIILATALSGAWTAVASTFSLISGQELRLRQVFAQAAAQRAGLALWIVLVTWLVLAVAGVVVQLRTTAEPEV